MARFLFASVATVLVLFLGPGVAHAVAQPPAPMVELWGGLTIASGASGTLGSTYRPLMDGAPADGRGGQTLTFDTGRTSGFEAGVAVYPSSHVGVEFRFDRASPTLTGSSTDHDVSFTYAARPPPDYQLRESTYQRSDPWPRVTGSMTLATLSANLVVRAAVGSTVDVRVSGGLSVVRSSAEAESLAFTQARLGGHSVLFPETAALSFSLEPIWSVGVNVGGGLDIWIARHVAVTIDGRWTRVGDAHPTVRLVAVANPDQVIWPVDMTDVEPLYTFEPSAVHVNRFRAIVGLKVGL